MVDRLTRAMTRVRLVCASLPGVQRASCPRRAIKKSSRLPPLAKADAEEAKADAPEANAPEANAPEAGRAVGAGTEAGRAAEAGTEAGRAAEAAVVAAFSASLVPVATDVKGAGVAEEEGVGVELGLGFPVKGPFLAVCFVRGICLKGS